MIVWCRRSASTKKGTRVETANVKRRYHHERGGVGFKKEKNKNLTFSMELETRNWSEGRNLKQIRQNQHFHLRLKYDGISDENTGKSICNHKNLYSDFCTHPHHVRVRRGENNRNSS
jgi:hypothetical protein